MSSASGVRLTARGAIVLLFAITLVGRLTGSSALVGAAFVAGCVVAVLLAPRHDLLSLVVTPPLVFFLATLLVETVSAVLAAGSFLQALGLGLFTTMSAAAPWLFVGSALVLAIAWTRGLAENVRELREELAAAKGAAKSRQAGFQPEPEGYFEPRVYGSARDAAGPPPPGRG